MKEKARPRDRFDVRNVRIELIIREGVRRAFAEKLERYHDAIQSKNSAEVTRLLSDLTAMTRYHREPDSQLNSATFTPRQKARFQLSIPKLKALAVPVGDARALAYPVEAKSGLLSIDDLGGVDEPWDEGDRVERAAYAILHPRISRRVRKLQRPSQVFRRVCGPIEGLE